MHDRRMRSTLRDGLLLAAALQGLAGAQWREPPRTMLLPGGTAARWLTCRFETEWVTPASAARAATAPYNERCRGGLKGLSDSVAY